jgi:hypothetical protein
MDVAINRTGRKHIWMMGRKVDVRNGARMGVQSMLDRRVWVVQIQIPDKSLLI